MTGSHDQKLRRDNLWRLLNPRHVAFVGGANAAYAAEQCLAAGFEGPVWGVNPTRETLGGAPCFSSAADLPEAPDAVFLAVPRANAIDAVAALGERGAGGVVSYTAGFGELGGEGEELENRLIDAAGDTVLVGPNCLGLINYLQRAILWPFDHGGHHVERGVALISQSGMLGTNLSMHQRSLDIGYVISVGNQADVRIEDLIDVLVDNPAITAIGLYVETLYDVAEFADAALKALAKGVPIVALKVGRSEIGARATITHTGSLSGSDELYQALFDRVGVVRVGSPAVLLETLKMLSIAGAPAGRRVAALTCSGGDVAILADLAEDQGLVFPPPSKVVADQLTSLLPEIATVANPLDYTTPLWGNETALIDVFDVMLRDAYDGALMVQDHPRPDIGGTNAMYQADTSAFIAATRKAGLPSGVVSGLPENIDAQARDLMVAGDVAPLQGFADGVAAYAGAVRYGERRAAMGNHDDLKLPRQPDMPRETQVLDEAEGKVKLAAAGVPVPESRLVAGDDAPDAAAEIGFPVVVKLVSKDLPHKTEAGAVMLGLNDRNAVADAVTSIRKSVAAYDRAALTDRFLVEAMVARPVAEMLVGVRRDPHFGLALTIAGGGTLVELMGDAVTLLLPADRRSVEDALAQLKTAKLLDGYRGRPAGDSQALVDAILAVGEFASDNAATLMEADINPLMVLEEGVVAVDVLLNVGSAA